MELEEDKIKLKSLEAKIANRRKKLTDKMKGDSKEAAPKNMNKSISDA